MKIGRSGILVVLLGLMIGSCGQKKTAGTTIDSGKEVDLTQVVVPDFSVDSAMQYATMQVGFGSRTPGSTAWKKCADYIVAQTSHYCDTVIVQPFTTTLWDGSHVSGKNIIASLSPNNPKRILLAAHWDSRMWADQDKNSDNQHKPVPGANDGASGVALLIEMARVMSALPPSVGIDFVFFDIEDQGTPRWADSYEDDTWCKGSQYWSQHPHVPFYNAIYGILFDMVGTANPRYTKEEVSRTYANGVLNKVWNRASQLGYDNIFVNKNSDPILDDHLYVNQTLRIPTIDIVQNDAHSSFFPHWHTSTDNLDNLDKQTLGIVAKVVMTTIYSDYPSEK